jgi:uncharacterized protein
MARAHPHQTHPDVLKRLKRAEGQLRSVREMIEAGRPCLEVAQQLQAAASAVNEAKKTFISDHLDHCLDEAAGADGRKRRAQLAEFKSITRYL